MFYHVKASSMQNHVYAKECFILCENITVLAGHVQILKS